MSGATLQHGTEQFSAIPPWPANRVKAFERPTPNAGKSRITEVLRAAPTVSLDELAFYNACLVNDVGWWTSGILALYRTLCTMGYPTLAEAFADAEAFKEVALARMQETEKHIVKPYNLGLYLDAVKQMAQPVDQYPLQLGVAQLQGACVGQVLRDAKFVLQHAPALTASAKKGALNGHADDVKRLIDELTTLVAKLEKSKRAAEALSEAVK